MIRYRAASFFGRLHTPELLMGYRTDDETQEILDAERNADGVWDTRTTTSDIEVKVEPETVADKAGDAETIDESTGEVLRNRGDTKNQADKSPEMGSPTEEDKHTPEQDKGPAHIEIDMDEFGSAE